MRYIYFLIVGILLLSFGFVFSNRQSTSVVHESIPESSPSIALPEYRVIPDHITAHGVVIINPDNGHVFAAKNPHQRLMPASTTKMMTAIIALQVFDTDEIITITRSEDAIGKSTKFTKGAQYLVKDILKAALINSGNDAALSLADHYQGGYNHFVAQMNQQAKDWGLKDTHFSNVSGVEAVDHYSSAYDLAIIATHFMSKDILKDIVSQPNGSITSIDKKFFHEFTNTNELIGQIPGVIGIKTGWTDNAGECLITYIEKDTDYIIVVLNSQNRFIDTKELINWVYSDSGSLIP